MDKVEKYKIRRRNRILSRMDADWNEGDHPRDENGRFSSGGSSGIKENENSAPSETKTYGSEEEKYFCEGMSTWQKRHSEEAKRSLGIRDDMEPSVFYKKFKEKYPDASIAVDKKRPIQDMWSLPPVSVQFKKGGKWYEYRSSLNALANRIGLNGEENIPKKREALINGKPETEADRWERRKRTDPKGYARLMAMKKRQEARKKSGKK